MEHEFWHRAWEQGRQGWHQKSVNAHLTTWWDQFDTDKTAEVFVPLCGKSLDMLWLLKQGHSVVGNELNETAVECLFSENSIPVQSATNGDFMRWQADELSILCGDYFSLTPKHVAKSGLVFDRAALIALPQKMRQDYVKHMRTILAPGTRIFLITMAYDESKMSGPPFSVPDAEVQLLFKDGFTLEQMDSSDDPSLVGGLAKRGLDRLTETLYFIQRID